MLAVEFWRGKGSLRGPPFRKIHLSELIRPFYESSGERMD